MPAAVPVDPQRAARNRRLLLIGAGVVVVLAVATALIWLPDRGDVPAPTRTATISAVSDGVALGTAKAPVHVVVYEDFACAACADFELQSRDFLLADAAVTKVYVEYKPIATLNAYSTRALGAFAAVLRGSTPKAALKFHNALFDQQPGQSGPWPGATALAALAAKAGAKSASVQSAIAQPASPTWVRQVNAAATKAGVSATPTVLVDGTRLPAGHGIDALVNALETRIAKG